MMKSLYRREQIAGKEDVLHSTGRIPLPVSMLPALPSPPMCCSPHVQTTGRIYTILVKM